MPSKDTRLKGNKAIIIEAAGIDRAQELRSATLTSDDASGDPTFSEAAAGAGRDWAFNYTYKQDSMADSFARWIYNNEGATVQVRYAPSGNAVPTKDYPHYLFTAVVGAPGTIGGDASYDATEYEGEGTWKITSGKPTIDDGSDSKPVVNDVSPIGASSGQTVVLSGFRFTGVTNVKFGTTSVTPVVINDGTIAVTVPSQASGPVNITVVGAGSGNTSAAFAYTAAS